MKLLLFALVSSFPAFSAEPPPEAMTSSIRLPREESPMDFGLDVQYAPVRYNGYALRNGSRVTDAGHGAFVGFEWMPFDERFGKLGIGLGAGLTVHANLPVGAGSWVTLYTVPASALLSYRFDYFKGQLLVPFVKAGYNTTVVFQRSRTGGAVPGSQLYRGY